LSNLSAVRNEDSNNLTLGPSRLAGTTGLAGLAGLARLTGLAGSAKAALKALPKLNPILVQLEERFIPTIGASLMDPWLISELDSRDEGPVLEGQDRKPQDV
jgi:hypothetical protein